MLTVTVVVLAVLIAASIPIAAVLTWLAFTLDHSFSFLPLKRAMAEIAWQTGTEFLLVAIPLFILMGEILLRSKIAERMYEALSLWFSWLPGGVMHANIASCAMFAATSGSSVATAATVGTAAMPEIDRRKYNEPLFLGSLAAGGTLGILIPPSINLIIYGLLTETSVPTLYIASFLPGLLLAGLFMLIIVVICVLSPGAGGQKVETDWAARARSLSALLPPVMLFAIVVGSIYAGWATPTEAASLGVVASIMLAAFNGTLSIEMIRTALEGMLRTSTMIMLIVTAAIFLNFVLAAVGLPREIVGALEALNWGPLETLALIIVIYLVLGCFMETMSMLIATTPLIAPIVLSLGYDPIWFGVVLMILLETALITPPIGVNLFVVQGVRGRGNINQVIIGSLPFLGAMLVMIALLIAFPNIALWLPEMMK
ncbi:TRAP transporter large permease [Roseovarius sp. ZX-A-9]|uniref:TRAP transporter large permease n=1 Tax=Roseovarius sp. ZX-A-9 TaxID=3014783 RepID=UPI00232C9527|nr:TRAP transporter large permease [Roseovarius sp. ZX-A-9]